MLLFDKEKPPRIAQNSTPSGEKVTHTSFGGYKGTQGSMPLLGDGKASLLPS